MNTELILELQKVQLRIMDDIHRICVEHSLRYYLIGGSALGAVRHNGMIPWDIDIDIAMPRKDYEKFIELGKNELNPEFEIHDYRTDKNFGTFHAIVVLKGSKISFKFEENSDKQNRFGIFVDILPLDQWPENKIYKYLLIKEHNLLKKIRDFRQGDRRHTGNFIKRFIKKTTYFILRATTSIYGINKWEQNIVSRCNTDDEGQIWCSKLSHYTLNKLTMPKEYFGTPILHEFSSRSYYIPAQVDKYLSHLFGDYMKLPPEDKRYELIDQLEFASWHDKDGKYHQINS